ncbi:MAG: bifunctional pyr operon transcriptional regulator/uracil phosphoribosyltransferase PyrR [Oscillatoriales cyanobacterium SM2_2_1]|nr:bifunctional pyr operon transcriptional regulator/uracil phosphoribosyltransferase PyrR [Oscillatoriales cyanobacterium SM2_2_1]
MANGRIVEILSAEEVRRTVNRLSSQVIEAAPDLTSIILLGIPTRGVPLSLLIAQRILELEQVPVAVGAIDITFYRDDLDQIGLRAPGKTDIPVDLTGRLVFLIDDVIYSGRTVGAALSALQEYGRPRAVRLLTLVDRGHRELPIHPDLVGKVLPTSRDEKVKVYLQSADGRDGVELIRPL